MLTMNAVQHVTPPLRGPIARAVVLAGLMCALAGGFREATAGYIALHTTGASRMEAGALRIQLEIANEGNEPARAIATTASLEGVTATTATRPELAAGATFKQSLHFNTVPQRPGHYTIVVRIRYEDLRGHPFTVLKTLPLYTDIADTEPACTGHITSSEILTTGTLKIALTNVSTQAIPGKLRLLIPGEIACSNVLRNITVPAEGRFTSSFTIKNRWAQRGSIYRIFGVFDYVDDGLHNSQVMPALVRITPEPALSPAARRGWLIAAGASLVLFLAAQYPLIASRSRTHASRIKPRAHA